MTGKQHLALGFTLGLTAACLNQTTIKDVAIYTSVCSLASLIPDIDCKNSIIGKKLKISSTIISNLFKHRSITHTPIFAAFISWFLYTKLIINFNLPVFILEAWILGYLIHLIQDTFTKNGIRWLFPIVNKPMSLMKVKSGSKVCYLTTLVLYFIGLVIAVNLKQRGFLI